MKGENSIKLYGNDLQALTDTANKIKAVLATVQGITDLARVHLARPADHPDRHRPRQAPRAMACARRYQCHDQGRDRRRHRRRSLRTRQRPAFPDHRPAGAAISQERGSHPELADRRARSRTDVTQIPLSEVATIKLVSGAAYIYREQQERYLPIKFWVRERDLGSAIREAQEKIAAQVQLPPGSRLEWVGEFGNLQDAIERLSIVVPISLALIALLLWINFGSMVDTLLAMSVIPMAVFGGMLGLLVTGIPFSVSAAIGFIALFGIAVMDGIIILSQYNQLIDEGLDRDQGHAAHRRIADAPGADDLRHRGRRPAAGRAVDWHRIAGAEAAGGRGGRRHDAGAAGHPGHAAGIDFVFLTAREIIRVRKPFTEDQHERCRARQIDWDERPA